MSVEPVPPLTAALSCAELCAGVAGVASPLVAVGVAVGLATVVHAALLVSHALAAANIAIVESLDLDGIEAGLYHFSALPLRITGGDAAPVRAILWRD